MIDQAISLHQAGKLPEAIAAYRDALRYRPEDARLHGMLGVALVQAGLPKDAAQAFAAASRADPRQPDHRRNLAFALSHAGQMAAAGEAWNDLGVLYQKRRDYAKALEAFDHALALMPAHLGYRNNRCSMLCSLNRAEEAIEELRHLTVPDADEVERLNELGRAQLAARRPREAIQSFQMALAINPDYPQAMTNLGAALQELPDETSRDGGVHDDVPLAAVTTLAGALHELDRGAESIAWYRRALALKPEAAIIHWNLSIALLTEGDLAQGFAEYEWRLRWDGLGEPVRGFPTNTWQGAVPQDVDGVLLITTEQGFGDAIQFARYLPMLAANGYRVVVEVQRPLLTLFWSSLNAHGIDVIPRGDSPATIETEMPIGAHTYIMSLAQRYGTTLETIPTGPYLLAAPPRAALWRRRLAELVKRPGPKIGLVWAGRPDHAKDRFRSLSLEKLRALWSRSTLNFVSLQKGPATAELAGAPEILALGPQLHDFADTAAVIVNLDLVIAVDTSVAHLAGALGKPCWVMLPLNADWRWLRHRADSPWYPSLRLYRQRTVGDWQPVIDQIAADLGSL